MQSISWISFVYPTCEESHSAATFVYPSLNQGRGRSHSSRSFSLVLLLRVFSLKLIIYLLDKPGADFLRFLCSGFLRGRPNLLFASTPFRRAALRAAAAANVFHLSQQVGCTDDECKQWLSEILLFLTLQALPQIWKMNLMSHRFWMKHGLKVWECGTGSSRNGVNSAG